MPASSAEHPTDGPGMWSGIAERIAAYDAGRDAARDLDAVYERIAAFGERPVWIALVPRERAQAMLADAAARRAAGDDLPLYGIPFAIKDNIDLAGVPTTAACPDFAYTPQQSAFVVERLIAAGAIPVGKTNLDQFATGLNGTRSPFGAPASVFDATRISGGSSSGSAVAVAAGLVAFSLGTDTAGSGRVPAAFNNIIGLKPTKGLLSTRGVMPACRAQDCVSVFATTVRDALSVARIAAGFDAAEPYSRCASAHAFTLRDLPAGWRFGMPADDVLAACSAPVRALYDGAAAALEQLGGRGVAIDYAPFRAAADLLYSGPWLAERLAAIKDFAAAHPDAIFPVVREIILSGAKFSAVDAFDGQYRLAALIRAAEQEWAKMDVMLLPTVPVHPTIAAMQADPRHLNTALGAYTNFVNLMDLAALAVPAGFTPDGLPGGVTLVGRAFEDGRLALLGDRLHRALGHATLGASTLPLPAAGRLKPDAGVKAVGREDDVRVAVVGAHLAGQPLNHQLTGRNGTLLATTRTVAGYSLYALAGTNPAKPGLVRDGGRGGIEVEVWSLPVSQFGAFVAEIPAPLGIGTLELEDGAAVKGFLCEPHAVKGARDITALGGWRAFLAAQVESAR